MRHRKDIPILKTTCLFPLISFRGEVVFTSKSLSIYIYLRILIICVGISFSLINIQAIIQFDGTVIVGTIIFSHTSLHILIMNQQSSCIRHSRKSIDIREEQVLHIWVVPYLQNHLIVHLRILRFLYSMKLYSQPIVIIFPGIVEGYSIVKFIRQGILSLTREQGENSKYS